MIKSFSFYLGRFIAALAAGILVFAGATAVAHAETRIDADSSYLSRDTVWDESDSPYVVTDPVVVPDGLTLTIEPGVSVVGSEEVDGSDLLHADKGQIRILGSPGKPVSLSGYGGLEFGREATGTIESAIISLPGGIGVYGSSLRLASTTVMNASQALQVYSSDVTITGSQIKNNDAGIFVGPSNPQPIVHPMLSGGDLSVSDERNPASSVRIAASDITDNHGAAIENQDASAVEATNDWWGSDAGPSFEGPNALVGSVAYDPWQRHASTTVTVCCSSVLFIPGLEASRIYAPERRPLGLGTSTVMAWEPQSNPDVKTAYLNPDGTSVNPNVYSGDPIGRAYGLFEIYGSFMESMDRLVADGVIGQWKAFGYDWRKPIAEVVAGRERKATTTESLIDTVMAMASSSRTGKVTLVAHSNGGLVAKYLVKTLADMGKADLVDKMISVAVPYLGTPLAVPSLLYGDGMSLAGGLLLKQSVAQKLGENMASAYSLLPSATYFSKVLGPTIAYASGSSSPISDAASQDSFIGSKLNRALMAAAESIHAVLDPFRWPTAIQRWALVGWGNDTVKSLVYKKSGSDAHTASTTILGDSTVVAASAAYDSGTTTALDLPTISKLESTSFNHQNIMSASTTDAIIADIVENKATNDSLARIPGVSVGLPSSAAGAPRVVVSTHSPVDLHVYDQYGNHTGIIPAPAGSGVTDDVVTFYETKIPGSSFSQNGGDGSGDDSDTEISLPADRGQKYSVSIQGNGAGEFTYEIQRFNGDTLLSDVSYSGLPATPLMVASTTIDSNSSASSSASLSVDIDGDGATDIIAKPGTSLDPQSFFEAMKRSVASLLGSKAKRANDLAARIGRIEALFKKDKSKKVVNMLERLKTAFGHRRFKNLTQSDRDGIVDLIDSFLKGYEN